VEGCWQVGRWQMAGGDSKWSKSRPRFTGRGKCVKKGRLVGLGVTDGQGHARHAAETESQSDAVTQSRNDASFCVLRHPRALASEKRGFFQLGRDRTPQVNH
jgi:hypothetical protein